MSAALPVPSQPEGTPPSAPKKAVAKPKLALVPKTGTGAVAAGAPAVVLPALEDESTRWKRHVAFLAPAVAMLAVSGWKLARDFAVELQGLQPDGPPIASAKNPSGDVKRRPSTRFRWLEVPTDSPLFSQDSVRTAAGAQTQVVLKDGGGQVLLGENSLLVLTRSGSQTMLKLSSGTAQFQSGKTPLLIQAQGKTFEASQAQGQIAINGGQTQIQLAGGTLVGKGGSNALRISGNQALQLAADGAARVGASPPIATEPTAGAQFVGEAPISFHWAGRATQIEVFKAEGGALTSVLKRSVKGSSTSFALEAGTYEWRLLGEGSSVSPSRKLIITARSTPRLLAPASGAQVAATSEGVMLSWAPPSYSDQQTLWISPTADFGAQSRQVALTRETAAFVALPVGRYYWKVESGVAGSRDSAATSSVRSFQVVTQAGAPVAAPAPEAKKPKPEPKKASKAQAPKKETKPAPKVEPPKPAPKVEAVKPAPQAPKAEAAKPAPAPATPAKLQSIPLTKLAWVGPKAEGVVSVATGSVEPKAQVTLGFPATKDLPFFKLTLKHDGDVVFNDKASGPQVIDLSKPGKYTWSAETPEGKNLPIQGATSGSFEVAATFKALELQAPETTSNRMTGGELQKQVTVKLRWKPYPKARAYTLTLAKDPELKDVILTRTLEKSEYVVTQDILQGNAKFYYAVQTPAQNGFLAKSSTEMLVFNFHAPRPVAPADKTVVHIARGGLPLIVTWEKTNGTDGYTLEVARDPGFKNALIKKDQAENFLVIDAKQSGLRVGTYYWRVRGLAKPLVTDPSPVRSFTLK